MARPGFWIDTVLGETLTVNVQQVVSLMTNYDASQSRRGWTLVRTIIGFDIARAVHDSGEGSHLVSSGIGIAFQEAFGVGQTAIPSPQTPTDFPVRGWIWRAQHRVWGFAADQPTIFTARIDKDIRAKRKLDNGEMYVTFMSTLEEGAAATIQVNGLIRQYWLDE